MSVQNMSFTNVRSNSAVITWNVQAGEEDTLDGVRYGIGSLIFDTGEAELNPTSLNKSVAVGSLSSSTTYIAQGHSRVSGQRNELSIDPPTTVSFTTSSLIFTNITITDQANAVIDFHTDITSGNIEHLFFYFASAPGSLYNNVEPFGYTNSAAVVSLGSGNYRATFSPSDAGVSAGQNIYFIAGSKQLDTTYDMADGNGTVPVPQPTVVDINSSVDRSTGSIAINFTYVNGPSTFQCFMWRYLNGDNSSPLTYSENFSSDDGFVATVVFNPYLETGTIPTDGAIAYNILISPGSCDTFSSTIPYDFTSVDQNPGHAPDSNLNRDFYQDEVNIALTSNSSGRLDASTGNVLGSLSDSIKSSPRYISPDNFMDSILR